MADNPYSVLGVSRKASDDDIRKAFRKLAKELHPDLNRDNPDAAERFKKVGQAYDILGDPTKRAQFDRGEIGADGEQRRAYPGAGGAGGRPFGGGYGSGRPRSPTEDMGFGDIFSDIFGNTTAGAGASGMGGAGFGGAGFGGAGMGSRGAGQRAGFPMRGQDVNYALDIEFLEAVRGARKRVTLPSGQSLDLSVPIGVDDGKTLRLRGKGHSGHNGGTAGDALIEITVKPHPTFTREGRTIRSTVPISIDEAVLGGRIPIDTIDGTVQLNLPKGTNSGKTFRLKGRGIPASQSGTAGDHLVTVEIWLPDTVDDSLTYFMQEWRQSNGYDPRAKQD